MRTCSSRTAGVALVALLPALVGWNWLQSRDPDVRSGNRHFKAGEYSQALKNYRSALRRGGNDEGVQFDIGTALYKLASKAKGKRRKQLLDQAEVAFRHAADAANGKLKSSAYFNLGNTQFARKRWDDAISAYKNALESNPKNGDARYNLELALRRRRLQKKKQRSQQQRQQNRNKQHRKSGKQQQQSQQQQSQQKQQQSQQQQSQQQSQQKQQRSQQQQRGGSQSQKRKQQQSQQQQQSQAKSQKQQRQKRQQQQQRAGRGRNRHGAPPRDRAGRAGHNKLPSEADRKLDELERLSRKAWLRRLRERARGARRIDSQKDQ